MNTGLKITGGKVEKQAVEAVAKAVTTIFDSASKNNMDQPTVQKALEIVERMGTVNNVSVAHSSFSG